MQCDTRLGYIMRVSKFTLFSFVFCYFIELLLYKMFILGTTLMQHSVWFGSAGRLAEVA
jgi:hypothetical protein